MTPVRSVCETLIRPFHGGRRIAVAILFGVAAFAGAETPTPQQIQEVLRQVHEPPESGQRLFRQARDMQACLAQLPPGTLERLRARGEEMLADVRALCAAGARDEAASRARAYAQEMASSADLRALATCGTMALQLLADVPFVEPDAERGTDTGHVCDRLAQ